MKSLRLTSISLFVILIATSCLAIEYKPEPPADPNVGYEVQWFEINPPPGVDNPCYGFVTTDSVSGGYSYSFSGISCDESSNTTVWLKRQTVEWYAVNPPPGITTQCYAFYSTGIETIGYSYSFSGVYCPES